MFKLEYLAEMAFNAGHAYQFHEFFDKKVAGRTSE
jgi:hypothetical protein